jgi:hypothetical protein
MDKRGEYSKVLDAELRRWSEMTCDRLIEELREERVYRVSVDSKQFQVEVQLLENTDDYLHIALGVDDGTLPSSIFPETRGFIKKKGETA